MDFAFVKPYVKKFSKIKIVTVSFLEPESA
jgi:hypothetical protein